MSNVTVVFITDLFVAYATVWHDVTKYTYERWKIRDRLEIDYGSVLGCLY